MSSGSRKRQKHRHEARAARLRPILLVLALGLIALGVVGVVWWLNRPAGGTSGGAPVAWARLGTEDVHSLAFAPDSTDHLYFGHHGGLLESKDGGRSWSPLPLRADAMGMRPASDGSIVIAGHDVLVASRDQGATWERLRADLPNIDIHAFARDPGDPKRMWAYLAEGGLYETRDGGTRWNKVYEGHVPHLFAYRRYGAARLVAIEAFTGLVHSEDGGRTWSFVSAPPDAPLTSMTATPDGRVVLIGSPGGVYRSEDGGRTWVETAFRERAMALAISPDGSKIALVSGSTEFYRSDDGGRTWPGPN